MVLSYWDMVAGIVNRGLINDELFFDSNGEIWVVWDRIRSVVPTWRAAFKNLLLFHHIEETCKRLESWRAKRPPGAPPPIVPILLHPNLQSHTLSQLPSPRLPV